MGIVKGSSKVCLFVAIGSLFILRTIVAQEGGNEARKLYNVYLGERQHDDPEMVSASHHRMLESVFDSAEAARKSIVYNYHHGFSGFAAWLTDSQAKTLSDHPDSVHVTPNRNLQLTATRMFDYLGLSPSLPTGLLHDTNMGSDMVIGVLDTGLWPESATFNDEGLGPIPKYWKGECVAGEEFDPAKHCNKKIIGAKYYFDGVYDVSPGFKIAEDEYMSPRDSQGHGTRTSSFAVSSIIPNVTFEGFAHGVMRGGAPKARVAMYKICWSNGEWKCTVVDMSKAIDDAIHDGVSVLSLSIAPEPPLVPLNDKWEFMAIGAFHAVANGIPVVAAAGNIGPGARTLGNGAPWMITVGASSMDRNYMSTMTLGNNVTFPGLAMFTGKEVSAGLVYVEDVDKESNVTKGNVVLTFIKDERGTSEVPLTLLNSGAVGVIIARSSDGVAVSLAKVPSVVIDYEVGAKILRYIRSSTSPTATISPSKTLEGRPIATTIPGFSSRGPNSLSPSILKPDIVSPGYMVLGADTTKFPGDPGYLISSGTSYATPAIAGIIALLKSLHPDWSPAALKSAIMTTAWRTDPSGEPIFSEVQPRKLADPFDYGAGLVNPEKAKDPGLVYDMGMEDYIHYLCASKYNETGISKLTRKPTTCPSPLPSLLDVNYPAITIPDLKKDVTLTRTLTNVGPVDSVYRPIIEPPRGVKISVEPKTLVFNPSKKKVEFKVRVSTSHKSSTSYLFGSLTWTDGTRDVTIPLSIRTQISRS